MSHDKVLTSPYLFLHNAKAQVGESCGPGKQIIGEGFPEVMRLTVRTTEVRKGVKRKLGTNIGRLTSKSFETAYSNQPLMFPGGPYSYMVDSHVYGDDTVP
jgi:hypothetical protein